MTRTGLLPTVFSSGVSAALAAAVCLLMLPAASRGAPSHQTAIRAERIEMVDASGAVRARLRMEGGDSAERAALTLFDQAGQERVSIGVAALGEAFLRIGPSEPQLGTSSTITSSALGSALQVLDPQGTERVQIGVSPTGTPQIRLLNEAKQPIWQALPAGPTEPPPPGAPPVLPGSDCC
jgi:hypothetical protein